MAAGAEAAVSKLVGTLPVARIGEPEEVSNMVVYLASDESSYSTGSEFVVDGGLLASTGPLI
jgi:3alpha(or 20beta)-hydroxysteroid dehydrogenase